MSSDVYGSIKKLFSLEGKKAIVTGSGGGIGSAIASGFAEFGVDIALIDLNAESIEAVRSELLKSFQ